jgi:F-type H+-transporting ATPase subunit a
MPEETSFFSYLIAMFPALGVNVERLGHTAFGKPVSVHSAEPVVALLFVAVLIIVLAFVARGQIANVDEAVIPDQKLTLRTFMEVFIGYFYDLMKDMMGAKRAKRYFPVIGTLSLIIFFSNILGLIPGLIPPTSSLNTTVGCAAVAFLSFNYYGIKENGLGYFKHLAGPVWWLAPLILPIELLSLCIRPVTLSIRLMLNMAVDHLLVTIVLGMIPLLVPIPILMLGTLVCVVQVLVFCLLTSIYITLATEHEDHGDHGDHAKPAHEGHDAHGSHAAAH